MSLISSSTIKESMNATESMSVVENESSRLHKACEAPQSLHELNIVLREFPRAIKCKTYNGNLPIHTACLNQAGLETLKALVEDDPMSVFERDDHGNTPLHLAAFSGSPLSSIKFLVHRSPESIFELNHNGQTPLDKAKDPFFGTQSIAMIKWLEYPYFLEEEEARFQVNFAMGTTNDDPTVRSSKTEGTFLLPGRLCCQEGSHMNCNGVFCPDEISMPSFGTQGMSARSSEREADQGSRLLEEPDSSCIEPGTEASFFQQSSFYRSALESATSPNSSVDAIVDTINSALTENRKRPGVFMVNEPAIHPSSTMYRDAYHR